MAATPDREAWFDYFWPGTDVLRNSLGIRDADTLSSVEYRISSRVEDDITSGNVPITGDTSAQRLSSIHRALLGDVYTWVGEPRIVNMTKGGHGFGDHNSMSMYLHQLDRKITQFDWNSADFNATVTKLGDLHTDLNFAHPFREGNGRTSRLFMTDLAARHGIDLDFTKVSRPEWNTASAKTFLDPAGINLDPGPLQRIYRRIATPTPPHTLGHATPLDPADQVPTPLSFVVSSYQENEGASSLTWSALSGDPSQETHQGEDYGTSYDI